MSIFLKAIISVFITAVLSLVIGKHQKDLSLILVLITASMIIIAAVTFLTPIVSLMENLSEISQINDSLFSILLKTVGVALISEFAEIVCNDAGNKSLGKSIHILSVAVILWLSIPLFNEIVDLLKAILAQK